MMQNITAAGAERTQRGKMQEVVGWIERNILCKSKKKTDPEDLRDLQGLLFCVGLR
jgi:hypothetical protein